MRHSFVKYINTYYVVVNVKDNAAGEKMVHDSVA
jgi:hypothetical protein